MWWAHSRQVLFSPRWRPFSLKTLKINRGSENSRVRPASNFIYLFIFTWFWFSRTHSHPSPEIVTILTNVTRFRFEKASLLETCSHRKTDAKEKKKSLLDIWGATVRIQTEDQTAGLDKKRWWQNNGKSDSLQISSSWLGERCCRSPEAARTAAGAGRGGCTPCPLCRWSRWLSAKTSGPMWVHVRKWIHFLPVLRQRPNTCSRLHDTEETYFAPQIFIQLWETCMNERIVVPFSLSILILTEKKWLMWSFNMMLPHSVPNIHSNSWRQAVMPFVPWLKKCCLSFHFSCLWLRMELTRCCSQQKCWLNLSLSFRFTKLIKWFHLFSSVG